MGYLWFFMYFMICPPIAYRGHSRNEAFLVYWFTGSLVCTIAPTRWSGSELRFDMIADLFVPQCIDWVEAGGTSCRVPAEEYPDGKADNKCQDDRLRGDDHGIFED